MPQVGNRHFPYTPQGRAQARRARAGDDLRARYRERGSQGLRKRLGELPEGAVAAKPGVKPPADPRRKAILAVLRNRTLRNQFGRGFRRKAYGDIPGYARGLRNRIGAAANDPKAQEQARAALSQVRARRQSFRPGMRYSRPQRQFGYRNPMAR